LDTLAVYHGEERSTKVIPVTPQCEPVDFDATVRQPGLNWLRERVKDVSMPLPIGFRWTMTHWTACLDNLGDAYGWVCAFAGVRIPKVVGSPTVEHFRPKSQYPTEAYEWTNFRLMCGLLNGRKGDYEDVLDPFALPERTFCLDLSSGAIYPNPTLEKSNPTLYEQAKATIKRLKLDSNDCRTMRLERFDHYVQGKTDREYLELDSPFIWYEAQRQGLL
jgi:hypothetical protein